MIGQGYVPLENFHCNPRTSLNFNPGDWGGGAGGGLGASRARSKGKLCNLH